MKYKYVFLLSVLLPLFVGNGHIQASTGSVNLKWEQEFLTDANQMVYVDKGNRTIVPLRATYESLGYDVHFEKKQKWVRLQKNGDVWVLYLNKPWYKWNNRFGLTSEIPKVKNGRVYIPIRYWAEKTAIHVDYDKKSKTVNLLPIKKPSLVETKPFVPPKEEPIKNPPLNEETKPLDPIPPTQEPIETPPLIEEPLPIDPNEVKLPQKEEEGCYVILTVGQLQAMNEKLDGCFELGGNIDATHTKEWNEGKGFEPVGSEDNPFTGTLDGKGFTVEGLYIHRPEEYFIGLINAMDAHISDIHFQHVTIEGGNQSGIQLSPLSNRLYRHAGGSLAGFAIRTEINNISVKGAKMEGTVIGGVVGAVLESDVKHIETENIELKGIYAGGQFGIVHNNAKIQHANAKDIIIDGVYGGGIAARMMEIKASQLQVDDANILGSWSAGGAVALAYPNSYIDNVMVSNSILKQHQNEGLAGGVAANLTQAQITNISLVNNQIESVFSSGGVTGYMEDASVGNGFVKSTLVKMGQTGGGVSGDVRRSEIFGMTIEDSEISGAVAIGGIFGYDYQASSAYKNEIKNNEITSPNGASGVGGSTSQTKIYENTLANLKISGGRAGGLIGYDRGSSEAKDNTISHAEILGTITTGGLGGTIRSSVLLRNVISDSHIEGKWLQQNGLYGLIQGSLTDAENTIINSIIIPR